ncbi:hypothetical protein ACIRBX_36140 [Kitasatospora sp. NPDC096147]|uniref:hypothetical protein n=1 Tax=Kitasatospora sp. NPDC096147 TaxID=3364093 RepID=UPI00380A7FBE
MTPRPSTAVDPEDAPHPPQDDRPTTHTPWIRTRLRAMPLATLLTALLALTTAFLATALPLDADRSADRALRGYLAGFGTEHTSLHATAAAVSKEPVAALDQTAETLRRRIGTELPLDPAGPVYGSRTDKARAVLAPKLTAPEGLPPTLGLLYLHDARSHLKLTAGHWPGDQPAQDGLDTVLVSESAAGTLGIRLDDVLEGEAGGRIRVAGLYTADPEDPYWTGHGCALRACEDSLGNPPTPFWTTTALVGENSVGQIRSWSTAGSTDFWRLPVDTGKLRSDRLPAHITALAAITAGPIQGSLMVETDRPGLRVRSALSALIEEANTRQRAARALTSVGPVGAAGVVVVVLCLAAALTTDRRLGELRLLRARGAGRTGLALRLLGESAVTVLPAATLGTTAALLLLPTYRHTTALTAGASVTLLALLAFPLRALLALRPPGKHHHRRRLIAELLLLAATVAAVTQARRRGLTPLGEEIDPLLIGGPLLIALTGAVLLARLQPLLIGLPARWSARRTGAITFLGLTRAARSGPGGRPSALPLLALLIAVGCAAFGATTLTSVVTDRAAAARFQVGGDAAVRPRGPVPLPDGFAEAASRLPGVRLTTAVHTEDDVTLVTDGSENLQVNLVAADPEPYARMAEVAGRGTFDPALLQPLPDGLVPALVSPSLPQGEYQIYLPDGQSLRLDAVGRVDGSPAVAGTSTTVVLIPTVPGLGGPNSWHATGPVDEAALRELADRTVPQLDGPAGVRHGDPGYRLATSATVQRELAEDPLQAASERTFRTAVTATALYAVLAVLLTLVRATPERAALLARLRTMGLKPRQGLTLVLAESLPPVLLAATGGATTATAAILLLGPAIDLTPLVGATVTPGLTLRPGPVLTQALGLAALATTAVLAEAALTARRQITTELRAGDQ